MVPRRLSLVVCSCVLLIILGSFPDITRATLEEGAILWRWTEKLHNRGMLINWENGFDPCRSRCLSSGAETWRSVWCTSDGFVSEIDLGGNDLSGPIAAELGQLSRLKILHLANNKFDGSIPPELGNLSTLSHLDLSNNKLSGEIPSSFGNLLSASYIKLNNNNLSGSIPVEITKLPKLTTLHLNQNNFYGSIPLEFGNLSALQTLLLSNNKLTGGIPASFGNLLNVTDMHLSGNNFSGNIPSELGNLAILSVMDISSNKLTGEIPTSFGKLLNATYMVLNNNNLSGSIPSELGNLSALKTLILSNNKLNGEIPTSFGNLLNVVYISLSFNNLSGSIPVELTKPSKLTDLQVESNNLSGRVYANGSWSNQRLTAFDGNNFCGTPVKIPCPGDPPLKTSSSGRLSSNNKFIIITVVSISFGVATISVVFFSIVRRLKRKIMALRAIEEEFAKKEVKPNLYSYNELKAATQNFSRQNLLGQGGYGTVYKGVLPNGVEIAVKQLSKSKQVLHEFLNEIVLITGIRHCNLVKLKGCCLREDQRILVYEYIDNGDLSNALWNYNVKGKYASTTRVRGLDWMVRLNIILEVAQGLTYLHEHMQPPIIHRDIKAPNILLDRELRAKIADFGLALLFPPLEDGRTHLSAAEIAGTRGYMAPEYASFGQVTTKIDVFSFGVLVLEIVSGRKNVDMKKPPGQQYLLEWVWELHVRERLHNLVDKKVTIDSQNISEITRVIRVGLLCIQYVAAKRPRMSDVVAMMQGHIPLPDISTNYEPDLYKGHEVGHDSMTSALERTQSEFGDITMECKGKSSMLYPLDEPSKWHASSRATMELTYRSNGIHCEPFDGYWT